MPGLRSLGGCTQWAVGGYRVNGRLGIGGRQGEWVGRSDWQGWGGACRGEETERGRGEGGEGAREVTEEYKATA